MTRRMCDLPPKRIPIASLRAVRSTCKLERRTLHSIGRRGRRTKRTSMCDLPAELVGEKILTRVPITSLRAVRSTCKLWDALTKDWILGKAAAARQQFLGFMTKDSKVCSVRFHLCRSSKDKEDEDLLDLSVKQVDLLDQVEISRVFHCDGLLLCVAQDHSRLVMWNPYLGQTQWVGFTTDFDRQDCYALGYDINRNHKILRFLNSFRLPAKRRYEIYEFSSNSWRVLKVTPDWDIESHHGGVSLKGNTYFYALESPFNLETDEDGTILYCEDFLLCFDFTTERFGPRLPLPFHSYSLDTVALSCVREEKLAVLYQPEGVNYESCSIVQIWVTTTIEPNYVSWSPFLRVEMKPFALTGIRFNDDGGSFFIDEEEKVAVVFDRDGHLPKETGAVSYHTAFVIGEGGYFKSVSLGVAHNSGIPCPISGYIPQMYYCTPLVCSSSYLPSLVQLNQPHKGKERGV